MNSLTPSDTTTHSLSKGRKYRISFPSWTPIFALTGGLVALNAFNVTSIPWVWVFAPIWAPYAIIAFFLLLMLGLLAAGASLYIIALVVEFFYRNRKRHGN